MQQKLTGTYRYQHGGNVEMIKECNPCKALSLLPSTENPLIEADGYIILAVALSLLMLLLVTVVIFFLLFSRYNVIAFHYH